MSSNESINEELECPVCYKIPRGPIFQCNRGHIVCKHCRTSLAICPQCKATLKHNVRSLVAEKIRDKVPLPCIFEGCEVQMRREELEKHEKICASRDVLCPVMSCGLMIAMPKLAEHVNSNDHLLHFLNGYNISNNEFGSSIGTLSDFAFKEGTNFLPLKIFFDETYFICRQCRNNNGFWSVWLFMIESENSRLTDYSCSISIVKIDEDGFERKITSICRPISIDVSVKGLETCKNRLGFTDDIAREFITTTPSTDLWPWETKEIRYTICIEKINSMRVKQ